MKNLIKFFAHHGIPQTIISDNGGEFKNSSVQELLKLHKIEIHFITSQHPESNGCIERFHSTLIEHIRLIHNQKEYKDDTIATKVTYAVIAYNNTRHSATQMTPYELISGHTANRSPLDIDIEHQLMNDYINTHKSRTKLLYETIHDKITENKEKTIAKANQNRESLPTIPEKVFVKNRQTQSKTKNKYNAEKIISIDETLKTANIAPRHANTSQRIHLSNIKRPKKPPKPPNISHVSESSPGPSSTEQDTP